MEVLDGGSFSQAIKQLETEWKAVLSQPVRAIKNRELEWFDQRLAVNDQQIARLERMISRLLWFSERQAVLTINDERNQVIARQYQSWLTDYTNQLKRAQRIRQRIINNSV